MPRLDDAVAQRYDHLGQLDEGTFGRAFFDHYRSNGYAFPGRTFALVEAWATPDPALAAVPDDQVHREDFVRDGLPEPPAVSSVPIADRPAAT